MNRLANIHPGEGLLEELRVEQARAEYRTVPKAGQR